MHQLSRLVVVVLLSGTGCPRTPPHFMVSHNYRARAPYLFAPGHTYSASHRFAVNEFDLADAERDHPHGPEQLDPVPLERCQRVVLWLKCEGATDNNEFKPKCEKSTAADADKALREQAKNAGSDDPLCGARPTVFVGAEVGSDLIDPKVTFHVREGSCFPPAWMRKPMFEAFARDLKNKKGEECLIKKAPGIFAERVTKELPASFDDVLLGRFGMDRELKFVDIQRGMRLRVDATDFMRADNVKQVVASGEMHYMVVGHWDEQRKSEVIGFDPFLTDINPSNSEDGQKTLTNKPTCECSTTCKCEVPPSDLAAGDKEARTCTCGTQCGCSCQGAAATDATPSTPNPQQLTSIVPLSFEQNRRRFWTLFYPQGRFDPITAVNDDPARQAVLVGTNDADGLRNLKAETNRSMTSDGGSTPALQAVCERTWSKLKKKDAVCAWFFPRSSIAPEIRIEVRGHPVYVPVGTRLRDIVDTLIPDGSWRHIDGLPLGLKLYRLHDGKPIEVVFDSWVQRWYDIPLVIGDEVR